jgi:hypothetical protein
VVYSNPSPLFNNALVKRQFDNTQKLFGFRLDAQFSSNTRLLIRGNTWNRNQQFAGAGNGLTAPGATWGPAALLVDGADSSQFFASLVHTSQHLANELKGGFSKMYDNKDPLLPGQTGIALAGYNISQSAYPINQHQYTWSLADALTLTNGAHELKFGGEFSLPTSTIYWPGNQYGQIQANGGPVPANIQQLFPVWNDQSTWNIAALSPITSS